LGKATSLIIIDSKIFEKEDRDMKIHGKNTIRVRDGIEFRDHGGNVKRLINQETVGSKRLTISIVFLNPGEEVIPNKHEAEEAFFFIQGQGFVLVEGFGETFIEKNVALWVPSNAEHTFRNTGDEPLISVACKVL